MKNKIKYILLLGLFISCTYIKTEQVFAEPSPADNPPVDFQQRANGSEKAEINARKQQEEANARAHFQDQMGAPPEAFQKHEPQKPTIEEPQKVPDEIKKYLTDSEIVPIYCAMSKWKTGQFFSAMSSLKNNLAPKMLEAKNTLGIDLEAPNFDNIISNGQTKLDAICNTKTVAEAENLTSEFKSFGEGVDSQMISPFMKAFEDKMKQKGDELKTKIENGIQPTVEEESAKIQTEIEAEAKSFAGTFKFTKQPSESDLANMRAQIEEHLKPIIEQKKQTIVQKIQAKVEEIKNGEASQFIKLGKIFDGVDQKINQDTTAGLSEYDKYKKEAFDLRKKAVLTILNKNLDEGMKQLDASSKDIDEAKKNDSTILSVSEIKANIEKDKEILSAKIDSAMQTGNETAFQQAINDFKNKWEKIRTDSEKMAQQSVSKACAIATTQFAVAKEQINTNLGKINGLESKCVGQTTEECLNISKFSGKFSVLRGKLTDIQNGMNLAENMCKDPGTTDQKSLISLLRKIQGDGEDVKIYGESLDAEKSKVLADTAGKICAQIIPQIEAAKTEINNNDMVILKSNFDRCKNLKTEECKIVNELSSKFNELSQESKKFVSNTEVVEKFCKNPQQSDFEKISTTLNSLKEDGDKLKLSSKELQAVQAEKASEKAFCRAIIPELEIGKSDMTKGLIEADSSVNKACDNINDPQCKSSLTSTIVPKLNTIKSQASDLSNKISSISTLCASAKTTIPNESMINSANEIKKLADTIQKSVVDLKKEADDLRAKMPSGVSIKIEAEDETKTSLLPHTESWHSRKELSPSWRPSYYGNGVWYLSRGGESLTYNFQSPTTGEYTLWTRDYVDNFQPTGVRKVTYNINGKNYGAYPEVVLSKSKIDAQKGAFGWHKIIKVKVNAGANTMKVTKESTTSGAAVLDAFYLTTGNEVPPEK
ncbi:MAG: hypothetical protein WCO84_00580 [bacterium]